MALNRRAREQVEEGVEVGAERKMRHYAVIGGNENEMSHSCRRISKGRAHYREEE